MATVFFSYAHTDEELRKELEKHLAMLRRGKLIEAWHDRKIVPGQPFDRVISEHLEAADIILLLVSPDFLASDYCWDVEVRRAVERHTRGEAAVIPVILRPCDDWQSAPFGGLLALPRDGKPVTTWPNRDEAFVDVARGIRTALADRQYRATAPQAPRPTTLPAENKERAASRVSVRLPRTFSEIDRADFIEAAFAETAEFFETSLAALERENTGIQARFRRLDARRFTAVVYRDGRAAARCTIWSAPHRTFPSGIGYVANDSGETSSLNESFSVETGPDALHLKPLGMSFVGRPRQDTLTAAGAAQYLWELFLQPLQWQK